MGNTVCTDRVAMSLEDIKLAKRNADVLSDKERSVFEPYDHNIKALRVCQSTSSGASHGIACHPVALNTSPIVDTDSVYIVIHLQRESASNTAEGTSVVNDNCEWATELGSAVTPRGLAHPFTIDLQGMRWRSPNLRDNINVAVYVYRGCGASKYCGAMAMVHALAIERLIIHDNGFVDRLFHNATNQAARCAPAPVCIGRGASPSPALPDRDRRVMYRCNALLRHLHGVSTAAIKDVQHHIDASTSGMTPAAAESSPAATSTSQKPATGPAVPPITALKLKLPATPTQVDEPPKRAPEPQPAAQAEDASKKPAKLPGISGIIAAGSVGSSDNDKEVHENGVKAGSVWEDVDVDPDDREKRLRLAAPQVTEVLPFLFVGGEMASQDKKQLLEKKISYIVNAAAIALKNSFEDLFEYTNLMLTDSPDEDITALFPQVIALVENARISGQHVFIHCHQGVSRSCTLVLAYVMWYKGMSYKEAYTFVRERRNVCSPNAGFYVSLLRWEKWLAQPTLPRCVMWRYVPYNDKYLFPLCFRMVEPDHEGKVFLDSRTAYISVDTSTPDGKLEFHKGSDCPEAVSTSAQEAVPNLIHYSFYRNAARKAPTDSQERKEIDFVPHAIQWNECSTVDGVAMLASASNMKTNDGGAVTCVLGAVPEQNAEYVSFRKLLSAMSDNSFLNRFEEHQTHQAAIAEGFVRRKRRRDNPQEALQENSTSPAVSPARGDSPGSDVNPAYIAEDGQEAMTVVEFPFDGEPIDVYEFDDLAPDGCYAIRILGNKHGTRRPVCMVWLGSDFQFDEDVALEAFDDNLRESNFLIPPLQVVVEGDEPDELMAMF